MKRKILRDFFLFYDFLVSIWGSPPKVFLLLLDFVNNLLSWKCYKNFLFFLQNFTIIFGRGNKSSWWVFSFSLCGANIFVEFKTSFVHFRRFLTNFKCFIMFHFAIVRWDIKKKGPWKFIRLLNDPPRQWSQPNEIRIGIVTCMQ